MHEQLHEIRYEGYGPGGVAVMIDCLTGDREPAADRLRETLARFGGSLGARDSVRYLFNPVGLLRYPSGTQASRVKEAAFAAGAEDVVSRADGSLDVLTDPAECEQVHAALKRAGLAPVQAGVTMHASSTVRLDDGKAEAVTRMFEALQALECVRHVYSNADLSSGTSDDAILARV